VPDAWLSERGNDWCKCIRIATSDPALPLGQTSMNRRHRKRRTVERDHPRRQRTVAASSTFGQGDGSQFAAVM